MKKIVAFGASTSSTSINQQLAIFAAKQLSNVQIDALRLKEFEMPIFDVDREKEFGIPEKAHDFKKHLKESDGILVSFAEHNGSYSAAFKNIMDWISRIEKSLWLGKPMLLLATSPGGRGGQSVLGQAVNSYPHQGGNVVASFSLPSFGSNFSGEEGITNAELKIEYEKQLALFQKAMA